MTQAGSVYGEALYQLAKEEGLDQTIFHQLEVLGDSFSREPEFIRLLALPNLTKQERCQVLDDSFRGRVHPYLLNFLKILTEKGYIRHFHQCREAYTQHYHQDRGILPVTAVTTVALSQGQIRRLTDKLRQITGKQIVLRSRIDPAVLGGIRLDYDGQRLDDTVSHRMDTLRDLLKRTVL